MGLEYTVSGDGPSLVLLHPVGLSSAFWPAVGARFTRDFRVFSVDLAGHGASASGSRPGRMRDRVAEVAELIDQAAGPPSKVLGVSFGGMIAMNLAISFPHLVHSLILAACPPAIPPDARDAILERGRVAETEGMGAVIEATLERWFSKHSMSEPIVGRVRAHLEAEDPGGWAAAWEAVSDHDALARLSEIKVPTLLVAGEHDEATPLAAMKAISDAIEGSRLVVLEKAPHMIHLERPEEFSNEVDAFLAGLGSR